MSAHRGVRGRVGHLLVWVVYKALESSRHHEMVGNSSTFLSLGREAGYDGENQISGHAIGA